MSAPVQDKRPRTIHTVRHQDARDYHQLVSDHGIDAVKEMMEQQHREISAGSMPRALAEMFRNAVDAVRLLRALDGKPSAVSAVELPPLRDGTAELSALYAARRTAHPEAAPAASGLQPVDSDLREAFQAGPRVDAGTAPSAYRGTQPDLFLPPHGHGLEDQPCPCCIRRRDMVVDWKRQQPARKKHRPIYGNPRWWCLADREAKVRVKTLARARRRQGRAKGQHGGILKQSDLDVLYMIIEHQNDRTGQCNPSMARLAEKTGHAVSTVNLSIARLESAGFIVVIRRREKVREGKGAIWRTRTTSNGYHIVDPLKRYRRGIPAATPTDSEIPTGNRVKNTKEGSSSHSIPQIPGFAAPGESGVTLDG